MVLKKVRTIKAMQICARVCSFIRLEAAHRSLYDTKVIFLYFRQYRNPGKGASRKNGPCGHPSQKADLHGSLKHVTTLSVHVHIGARERSRPSLAFFCRGNIVAYEVLPRRDHCWLKTLPNLDDLKYSQRWHFFSASSKA